MAGTHVDESVRGPISQEQLLRGRAPPQRSTRTQQRRTNETTARSSTPVRCVARQHRTANRCRAGEWILVTRVPDAPLSAGAFVLRAWRPKDATAYLRARDQEVFEWTTDERIAT